MKIKTIVLLQYHSPSKNLKFRVVRKRDFVAERSKQLIKQGKKQQNKLCRNVELFNAIWGLAILLLKLSADKRAS